MSSPPPQPSTSQFASAPNEVVLRILKHLDQKDLRNASASCSKLQAVVSSHMSQLTRSSIYDLTLQCRDEPEQPVTLGKFRFPLKKQITKKKFSLTLRNKKKKQWVRPNSNAISTPEDMAQLLDETLKMFVIDGALNFDRFAVDSALYERLIESFADFKKAKLTFTLCKFFISARSYWRCSNVPLSVPFRSNFCENVDKLLSDEIFLCTERLDHVNVQLRDQHTRLELTDRVLEHWARQAEFPTRIHFSETKTCFTVSGVVKLIKAFQYRTTQGTVPASQLFTWDLGNILNSDVRELFIPNIASSWNALEDGCVQFTMIPQKNCKITFSTYLFATL